MEIRRHNFIAIMENYVATLIEKLLKKNVAILFCSVVTMFKQMTVEFFRECRNIKSRRVTNFYHDKRKLCRDRKWKCNETS